MRRLFWAAMGVALISMVFAGCKKDPTYSVQVTATEGGTVEGQNGEYKEGETVVFTAVPADGYYFSKWSDGYTDNPRTITIEKEITVMAQFAQNPLVTIIVGNNGKIETDVNGRYAPGSTVTVAAKPDADYYFTGWSDGNTDNPRTITIGNEDVSLTAYFFAPTVDLGLKSGTLWATCNLGATAPWNYGDYYAWGETETKDDYSWETYKHCKGTNKTFTKYCNNAEFGYNSFTDTLTTLLPEDDAAVANWGGKWKMPTRIQQYELMSQCYWVWTSNYNNRGVAGFIVYKAKSAVDKGTMVYAYGAPSASYSLSDAHIFLPAAGYRDGSSLHSARVYGYYWSASLGENPRCLYFGTGVYMEYNARRIGQVVRPVCQP